MSRLSSLVFTESGGVSAGAENVERGDSFWKRIDVSKYDSSVVLYDEYFTFIISYSSEQALNK